MSPLTDQTDFVRRAIEASLWDSEASAVPPDLTVVDEPDRVYWCGPANTPYANRIVRASFSIDDANAAISEILDFYSTRGKTFSWWVGPSSAPADLETRLHARGLRLLDTYEGVALPLGGPLPAVPPGVEVEQVHDEVDVRAMVGINAQIWGYSQADQERMVAERMAYLALPDRQGGYMLGWTVSRQVRLTIATVPTVRSSTSRVLQPCLRSADEAFSVLWWFAA